MSPFFTSTKSPSCYTSPENRQETILGQAALKIRPVISFELPLLKDFVPSEWNTVISQRFSLYFGQPYFYPILAELVGKIVGCANGLLNETTGGLGNIIVLPENSGQGIGSYLTSHLVEYFNQQGCTNQVLVATKLGEPVYEKLGFIVNFTYTFLHREKTIAAGPTPHIRRAQPMGFEAMRELDRGITGEKCVAFLERFLAEGQFFQADVYELVTGYYLPGLESGPIFSWNATAGLELLQNKLDLGCISVVVPTFDQPAVEFLVNVGFLVEDVAPRMVLGEDLDWIPDGVFSCDGGFCG